jgi:hypothetical protein
VSEAKVYFRFRASAGKNRLHPAACRGTKRTLFVLYKELALGWISVILSYSSHIRKRADKRKNLSFREAFFLGFLKIEVHLGGLGFGVTEVLTIESLRAIGSLTG